MDLINDWLKENVCHKPVNRQQYQDEVKAYWKGRYDKLEAENDKLKKKLLTPCVTCNAFIEMENLKEAIQAIIDHEEARKKCGCGYDLFVHDTAVVAIVF